MSDQPPSTMTIEGRRVGATSSELNHFFCCDPDRAICGADVSDQACVSTDEVDCVVCLDLEDFICPFCGE